MMVAILQKNVADSQVRFRSQIGLSNVDNTADADKPVSTATQAAIDAIGYRITGAAGNGADDTAALTAFYEHAIANPGVPHYLDNKVYTISGTLPDINVSNVWIEGAKASQHDVGAVLTGTVIKRIGANTSVPMLTITSIAGASNQGVKDVRHKGIWFDCDGKAAVGIKVVSLFNSDIDLWTREATSGGAQLDIVASPLGESAATNRCRLDVKGRQSRNAAPILTMRGSSVGNTSMSDIWFDGIHKDATAVVIYNADNNDWRYFRATFVSGGAASYSVEIHGSNVSANEGARAERFHVFTTKKPAKIYGTDTYTYPAKNISFHCIDTDNGTPAPTFDTGATGNYRFDKSRWGDAAWVAYTPTVTAASGSITTYTVTAKYLLREKTCRFVISVVVRTNGTGATGLVLGLPPVTPVGTVSMPIWGLNTHLRSNLNGRVLQAGTTVDVRAYDGTYPVTADGQLLVIQGEYEVV